ncbi:MAG TPA: nucleotidyltransferase domain-containing protein [Stellaceae bacterium]|nr:nucleotidyltransferase domain-containing protein [Stellaceae bacterium]
MNAVRLRAIEELRRMVLDALGDRDAEVWLFGSCARGDVRNASDIDIGILPREPLPSGVFADIEDNIEESTIPYHVDVVDLRRVTDAFLRNVRREGINWRE